MVTLQEFTDQVLLMVAKEDDKFEEQIARIWRCLLLSFLVVLIVVLFRVI